MRKRIAIVEDEPTIRESYADVLHRQGYAVTGYNKRAEALAAFRVRLAGLGIGMCFQRAPPMAPSVHRLNPII
jgi:two-component system OmpR family response regulator